jgi:two-component system response regulator DegU
MNKRVATNEVNTNCDQATNPRIKDIGEVVLNEVIIAIIDRSEFFKAGVRQKLSAQRDFRLMDCDPDDEPLNFIEAYSVDVVLLDIDFPISKGLELSRGISRHYPNTRVIMLSPFFNDEELFETIKTGAAAYIDKRTNAKDLISTIRKVSRGEYPINDSIIARPAIAERVLKQFQEIALVGLVKEKVAAPLTTREIQILSYIASGNTNKQVAYVLGISEQTIKNHVSAILRKLNANDRAHAVALAIRNQWVSIDER